MRASFNDMHLAAAWGNVELQPTSSWDLLHLPHNLNTEILG